MASSTLATDTDLGEQPSAAQKLLQKHNEHQPTVEDVPDEELKVDGENGDAVKSDPAAQWAPTMSAKAAGKQKVPEAPAAAADAPAAAPLDTQSHELFPELGAPKKASAGVVPIWSAKKAVNGKTNGASSANGVSRASTPASGATTPGAPALHGPPALSIPGRNVETVFLDPQHVLPRTALPRPIPDIIKDLNRRSRASIAMGPSTGGRMRFDATGPQDVAQQALKDLVQQIGTKVGLSHSHMCPPLSS